MFGGRILRLRTHPLFQLAWRADVGAEIYGPWSCEYPGTWILPVQEDVGGSSREDAVGNILLWEFEWAGSKGCRVVSRYVG